MIPHWVLKADPEHYPVRFLAGIWEQRLKANFGIIRTQLADKEMGQMKSLRKALGDLTQHVIEWMLNPVIWWHFCQQVRQQGKLHSVPDYPQIGFLLRH